MLVVLLGLYVWCMPCQGTYFSLFYHALTSAFDCRKGVLDVSSAWQHTASVVLFDSFSSVIICLMQVELHRMSSLINNNFPSILYAMLILDE